MPINPSTTSTIRVGELPEGVYSLTDNIPHEIGTDLFRGTIQDLITFITPFIGAIQFQVITLHVNSAYIAANFDSTGLGKNLMLGYAIVNGQNGTLNKDGRVGIAYGATSNVVGQFGGTDSVTVTSQTTGYGVGADTSGLPAGLLLVSSGLNETGEFLESVKKVSAPPAGQLVSIKQKYLVELQVMRL